MSFVLVKEQVVPKPNGTYSVKLFFDEDTNTARNEYLLEGEILYHYEYEVDPFTIPEQDLSFEHIVDAFNGWYDIVGPDWRPEAF